MVIFHSYVKLPEGKTLQTKERLPLTTAEKNGY